jgi:hypothetical protein
LFYFIIVIYIKDWIILELGISEAQTQFTQLLNQAVLVVDEKVYHKKAVILPYEEYKSLVVKASNKQENLKDSVFSQFVGVLDNDFKSNDKKYNKILK